MPISHHPTRCYKTVEFSRVSVGRYESDTRRLKTVADGKFKNMWPVVYILVDGNLFRLFKIPTDCRRLSADSIHNARRDEARQFCRLGSGGVNRA